MLRGSSDLLERRPEAEISRVQAVRAKRRSSGLWRLTRIWENEEAFVGRGYSQRRVLDWKGLCFALSGLPVHPQGDSSAAV